MSTRILEDVMGQPEEGIARPMEDYVMQEEKLLLNFYRQLSEPDRLFVLRAVEAFTIKPGKVNCLG